MTEPYVRPSLRSTVLWLVLTASVWLVLAEVAMGSSAGHNVRTYRRSPKDGADMGPWITGGLIAVGVLGALWRFGVLGRLFKRRKGDSPS